MNSGKYGLAKNRTYETITSSSYATTSSYALTASYALNAGGGGVNPTTGYIPYNNAGTFADSGLYYDGTNVGIGTTTPAYKLDVTGNTNFTLGTSNYIRIDGGYNPAFIQAAFSNFLVHSNVYYDGADWRYATDGFGAGFQFETESGGGIAFYTYPNGTTGNVATAVTALGISNNGYVRIGSGNASTSLDVSGSAIISGSLTVTGAVSAASLNILKAGSGSAASFTGTPLTLAITFGTAFTNNSYAVQVTGEDARVWSLQSKSSTGFTINSNSSVALTGPV